MSGLFSLYDKEREQFLALERACLNITTLVKTCYGSSQNDVTREKTRCHIML